MLIAGCALTPTSSTEPPADAHAFWACLDRAAPLLCVGKEPLVVIRDSVDLDWGNSRGMLDNGFQGRFEDTPDTCTSTGFLLQGRKDVTMRRIPMTHFKVGVYARNCENLVFDNLTFADMFRQRLHSTPDREDAGDWLWPHNNDNHEWMNNYGACIVLENCKNCVIRNCSAKGTQNGIILDRCEGCQIYNNDFSYCSGWGCALWRSSKNTVAQNRFDYCVRGYSDGVYARGQDSAGILVFEQCCDNIFAYNSATHSGDGFFLYAGHETTQRTGKGGCNRNLVYGNDFSYAVANGIEATFSDGNVFAKNKLVGCDYGIWGGYSYNTLIIENAIWSSNVADIAIEHGHDNWIEGNDLNSGKLCIWLWWDKDEELMSGVYGRSKDCSSSRNTVLRNKIYNIRDGVFLENSSATDVRENKFVAGGASVRINDHCENLTLRDNNFLQGTVIKRVGDTSKKFAVGPNFVSRHAQMPESNIEVIPYAGRDPMQLDLHATEHRVSKPTMDFRGLPDVTDRRYESGRDAIVIDQWGPVDSSSNYELDVAGKGNGVHWVVDGFLRQSPNVEVLSGNVRASVTRVAGRVARINVVSKNAEMQLYELKATPYSIFGDNPTDPGLKSYRVNGSVQSQVWNVNFWQWTPADGSDLPPDWDKLVASPPLMTVTKPALEYNIQGSAPEAGVPADHFATVATTEIELPSGSWKLVLTSDDGGRLFVDGEKVIEHWDIHGPSDDVYLLKLEKPRKVALRVEHFENTGWAALALRIERE